MQPLIAAMKQVRQAFFAAILKSLLRTKHLLKAILNIWISPSIIKKENVEEETSERRSGLQDFLVGVEKAFRSSVEVKRLVALSDGLQGQFEKNLVDHGLSLDVGGSTFRVALVELCGKKGEAKISKMASYKIGMPVKQLKGTGLFDWMAERIEETLSGQVEGHEMTGAPLSTGLAWSFPIEQTSLRSGLIQAMGKGFVSAHELMGQDLGDILQESCSRRGLNVRLDAIVNDSSATLLSKAYVDPTTRFSLILGTGLNAAVHLPTHVFSPEKYGTRPAEWHESAKHVIVNTELSMFGNGFLPLTKWDKLLSAAHPTPTFQPMEYCVSGGFLGEIVRLVLIDGIQSAGLFSGVVPLSLTEAYSLETETISRIECDHSPSLSKAQQIFVSRHPTSILPTHADIQALQRISSAVTYRAAGIVAAGVHGLWRLRNDTESLSPHEFSHMLVAYNGSVMENYPNFKESCQEHLDSLVEASGGSKGMVELMYAEESSLLGAAVAGAVASLEN